MTEMVNLTSNYSHDKVYLSVCIFDTYKIKVMNNQITMFSWFILLQLSTTVLRTQSMYYNMQKTQYDNYTKHFLLQF